MNDLQVAAERLVHAAPALVWPLVSDATRYPEWGPWSAAGYQRQGDVAPSGPGAVRWMRSERRHYLRYVTTVERVLEADEPWRLAYTVIGGIPVRNYRAEVTLTPVTEGTLIRWAATWDATPRGRLVRNGLAEFYPQVIAALATAAERLAAPGAAEQR